jgi:hypothetical protein
MSTSAEVGSPRNDPLKTNTSVRPHAAHAELEIGPGNKRRVFSANSTGSKLHHVRNKVNELAINYFSVSSSVYFVAISHMLAVGLHNAILPYFPTQCSNDAMKRWNVVTLRVTTFHVREGKCSV